MKLQLKQVIRLFIPIFLVELFLARMFLNPRQKELSRLESKQHSLSGKLAMTSGNIQEMTDKLNRLERELSSPITEAGLESTEGAGAPAFLEYISRLVQSVGIRYISIRLNQPQDGSPQTSYNLRVTSEYGQIVRLLDNLENQLNLDVQNFEIKAGRQIKNMHEASFDLAFLKMKAETGLPAEPEKLETVLKLARVFNNKKVGQDPFFHKAFPKPGSTARPRQDPLALQGIIDIMGKKAALINHHILHEGDKLSGYSIIKIGQDKVTLWRRKHRYVLSLRGLSSPEAMEIKQEKT